MIQFTYFVDKERSPQLGSKLSKTENLREDDNPEISVNDKEDNSNQQENDIQEVTKFVESEVNENIETLFELGCKTKVSKGGFADCIIMDFAGHKEYYSTHQTFLTTNAIYLVVFKFDEDDPFDETVEETGSFIIIIFKSCN